MKFRAAIAAAVLPLAAWLFVQSREPPAPAAHDMAAELAALEAASGVWDNPWTRHREKITALHERLQSAQDPNDRIDLRRQIAEQAVYAGQIEAAVTEYQALLDETRGRIPPAYTRILQAGLAAAYFRQGEMQNCLLNRARSACVFPLQGDGLHLQRQGAEKAAGIYRSLLQDKGLSPGDAARYAWLLNLAQMALGDWPAGVPEPWRLGPELFESPQPSPPFVDVASAAGVDVHGLSGGTVMDDFDGDGRLDIVASSWGPQDPLRFFHNTGDGQFEERTQAAGLDGINGGLNINQADYDNDGDLDLFVMRGAWLHDRGRRPNSLLRNDGQGRFTDVTAAVGLLSYYPTQTAAWADVDRDGDLDLVVGNEIVRERVSWPANALNYEMYRNTGQGRFEQVQALPTPGPVGMIKGLAWGDYDNDGAPDLYVSIWGQTNRLYRNLTPITGEWRFDDVTETAGVAEPVASFPTWFFDYDNDGWLDLFVSGYAGTVGDVGLDYRGQPHAGERPRLYRNLGNGRFNDVAVEAGLDDVLLTMGSNYGDLDNDGWPDLLLGTGAPPLETLVPNRAYRNLGGQSFADITTAGGFGHLQKGHGVAFGDYDQDGDQDIYAVFGGAFESDRFWNALYQNPGTDAAAITLRLVGTSSNRFGLGARIRLRTAEGREIHTQLSSGSSFGANPLLAHLGLGTATEASEIEVCWPGGVCELYPGPWQPGRYALRESATVP